MHPFAKKTTTTTNKNKKIGLAHILGSSKNKGILKERKPY